MYNLDDYAYELPAGLIAQFPAEPREDSRLLVLHRHSGGFEHGSFSDICRYLQPQDVLVVNDTRVVPGRLCGTKESGGRVELLVLDPYLEPGLAEKQGYTCLVKASKKPRSGTRLILANGVEARLETPVRNGQARVRFAGPTPLAQILEHIGLVPLPPYIERSTGASTAQDLRSYQTVYAQCPGAVAAPTAGLHFSQELLQGLRDQGVEVLRVTLHVGYGTFSPIREQDIRKHKMHAEFAEISAATAERLERARAEGRRIVAVGTTVVRVLEWVAQQHGRLKPFRGLCQHYIYPGYEFRVVQAMITNFHLPKSSLLLLVSAFAGRHAVLAAYQEAIRRQYRFFSYGDAMLIL